MGMSTYLHGQVIIELVHCYEGEGLRAVYGDVNVCIHGQIIIEPFMVKLASALHRPSTSCYKSFFTQFVEWCSAW